MNIYLHTLEFRMKVSTRLFILTLFFHPTLSFDTKKKQSVSVGIWARNSPSLRTFPSPSPTSRCFTFRRLRLTPTRLFPQSMSHCFSARVIPRPLPPPLPYTNVTVLHFPPPPSHPHPPLPSICVTLFPILTYPRKSSLIPYPTSPHDWVHQHDGLHCFMWTVLLPGFK